MKTQHYFVNRAGAWLVSLGVLTATCALAADEPFDRLVARWKVGREQVLRRMTQGWLRGEKAESFKSDLMNLSQMESGLATKPGTVLYLSQVQNPNDLNAAVGEVVRAYLKNRGAIVSTADFLRGKTFSIVKEVSSGNGSTPVPPLKKRTTAKAVASTVQ